MFTFSFTNSVLNTTISSLNLAFFHIGPLHQPFFFANLSFHSLLQPNKLVGACFLNLKKAFDSIHHKPLIDLLSSLHFPPYHINWLHSYLSACSQQVVISGTSSSSLPMTSRAPQGSIIGPLLFITYINGLCNVSVYSSKHPSFSSYQFSF